MTTQSGILVTAEDEDEEGKKKNSGLPKLPRWSHDLRSDQNSGEPPCNLAEEEKMQPPSLEKIIIITH